VKSEPLPLRDINTHIGSGLFFGGNMPVYDYQCQDCQSIQEIVTLGVNQEIKVICEECKSENMVRCLGGTFGFELKGEAWAKDGYQYEYTKSKANMDGKVYPVYGRKGVQEKLQKMRLKD
jgi:putative FmdB family regulatory protein